MLQGRVHAAARTAGQTRVEPAAKYQAIASLKPTSLSTVAVTAYLATFFVFFVVVLVSLAEPTAPSMSVAGVDIPAEARCLRSSRHADYASIWLPVGSPVRSAHLLLRIDRVVTDPFDALSLKSTIVSQSTSKVCNVTTSRCTDRVQVGGRKTDQVRNELTDFRYFSGFGDTSLAGAYLGLDGELSLVANFSYWITTSHLCWHKFHETPSAGETAAVTVNPTTRELMATTDGGLGPIGCNSTAVALFPAWASSEMMWLALNSKFLYEHAENALDSRRRTVEQAACNADSQMDQYWTDCRGSPSGCRSVPSVPFRRIGSMHELYLRIDPDGFGGTLSHTKAAALERVPVLMSTESATLVAVMRLLLMVLVAGVTYTRSSQTEIKSERLLLSAWKWYYGLPAVRSCSNTAYNTISTVATGMLAISARVVVIAAMQNVLIHDGQQLLVASEICGCVVSMVHLLIRQLPFLQLDSQRETTLTLYGGSMALVDVTCSMIVVFAETPLLGTKASFALVGRMLAAVLLSINCVNICVFAVVACASKGSASWYDTKWHRLYQGLHILGGGLWLVQTACVAATFCAAFVQPFSCSLVRAHAGAWDAVRFAVATGFVAASVPVNNRVVLDLLKTTSHGGKID